MGMNAAQKILWLHMVESKMIRGEQIVLRIDRAGDYSEVQADPDAEYDGEITVGK